jgi:hypothetical protein
MNISDLIQRAWRITRTNRWVWVLSGLVWVTLLPSLLLSGVLGGAAGIMAIPPARGPVPDYVAQIRATPPGVWLGLGAAAIVLLIITNAITYILQAAVMRGAALAAERTEPVSVREALQLGRERVLRLLRLSLTLGAALALLALGPVLAQLAFGEAWGAVGGMLFSTGQATLSLITTALSIGLLLVFLAIAVEDVRLRAAPGRAWAVLRKGWWAFVLVFLISAAPGVALALLFLPLIFVLAFAMLEPLAGGALLVLCCALLGPLGFGLLLVVAVFTNTLYTLVYRAAAQLADATVPPPAA